jgi:hypothetical protein
MKNRLFALAIITIGGFEANAQVGINTDQGQATLDVVGSPAVAAKLDGIIAPRITGTQLRAKNYGTAQAGALVYVTAADSAPAGQTINVTAIGYYYFDGSKWIKSNGTDWRTTGNPDSEIVTAAETLGTAPASANYLGTQGATDDLVIASGNKTHAVLNTTGALNGGGETTSSLSWGYNNTNNTSGSVTLNSTNNSLYGTTAQTRTITAANSANIILGRDNVVASGGVNIPSIAIGKNNVVSSGGRAIGTDNYAMSAASYLIGNGNVAYASGGGGYMFGTANEGSGFNFGTGTKTATNAMAIGFSVTGNARVDAQGTNALYLGSMGGVALSNESLYSNDNHVFATNTDASGNPIANANTGTQYAKVGVNMVPTGAAADLQVTKGILMKANSNAATSTPFAPTITCDAANAGTIMYFENTNAVGVFWGCSKVSASPVTYGWLRLTN